MQTLTAEARTRSPQRRPKAQVPPQRPLFSSSARERTVVQVGAVAIGAGQPVMMAGPCSVESYAQLLATAAPCSLPARRFCGVAPTSRVPLLTTFRGSASRHCRCCARLASRNGSAGRFRGSQHGRHRDRCRARGHAAGGSAQHAEFRTASAARDSYESRFCLSAIRHRR